jgi:ribosomal protein L11 methyltransferase
MTTNKRTSWIEIQIEVAAEAAEIVATVAGEIATEGIEVRDSGTVIRAAANRALVIAHVAPEQRAELLAAIEETAARTREAGIAIDPIEIRQRDAHEDEWRDVWKQFFRATRVGRSFIVRPSWDPGSVASGDRVIDLDPGRAFGTGGHASTRLVITLAEGVADHVAATGGTVTRFLDLGCGSGILSIAAARLWPAATGAALDLDADAVECTRENLERNGVDTVTAAVGSIDVVAGQPPFDVILANIQADVLSGLAAQFPPRLTAGGRVILSGLLLRDAEPLLGMFQQVGFSLVRRLDEGDWAALELRAGQPT